MRRVRLAILAALLACFLTPHAGAISMTLDTFPERAHIGDVVTISGTITDIKMIAVYLYITGPGLNRGGVTLENLNVPTGRGLYTTAPVDMKTGAFTYDWDTSVILGTLRPGKYTIYATYAMSPSVDQLINPDSEYASAEIEFLPPLAPTNEVPLPPILPFAALGVTLGIFVLRRRNAAS